MMKIKSEFLLERFLAYVQIGTRSDPSGPGIPSTPEQWDLLHRLVADLEEIGVKDITLTESGYVLARLPATPPTLGRS